MCVYNNVVGSFVVMKDMIMNREQGEKVFPSYFANFKVPEWARGQELSVYRACRTGKIEKESFLNTYEQNGFCVEIGKSIDDPSQYSL